MIPVAKRAAETLLTATLEPWLRRRQRGRLLVLAYHNVVPEGAPPGGDRSLHLPRADFARQLDALTETHQVVSLERALGAVDGEDGAGGRPPRAVVTFDDAYRGAMTAGLEEVARRGLPATVFVSPGLLGAGGFWWDQLPDPAGRWDREEMLVEEEGRAGAIRARAEREGWPLRTPPEHARPVTGEELLSVAGRPGVTLAAHGWSHANLAALEGAELRRELARPLAWLRQRAGDAVVPALAYPYGRHSGAARRGAREAGYRAAFSIAGGTAPLPPADPYRVPRANIPAGVTTDGFRLRALGLLA